MKEAAIQAGAPRAAAPSPPATTGHHSPWPVLGMASAHTPAVLIGGCRRWIACQSGAGTVVLCSALLQGPRSGRPPARLRLTQVMRLPRIVAMSMMIATADTCLTRPAVRW